MKQELVKINAAEYGLEESKAKQISDMFKPMLDKMTELEVQFNEVMKRPMEPETIQMAHDLRLAYVKVRTGTAAIHKDVKSFYRQGGLFVDGWKNAQAMASQGNEEKLRSIEDHFVNIEKERVAKLQVERSAELSKYTEYIPADIGEMADDLWPNYLSGVKLSYEARIKAEEEAEEKRLADIKAEELKQEKLRKQNWKLKKEAREREQAEQERINKEAIEKRKEQEAREKKAAAERKAREEEERKAQEKRDAEYKLREDKARKEREDYEAKIRKEREERERAEEALKVKAEAERKAKEEKAAQVQAELNKGDAAKVQDLITDLEALKIKYTFKSQKNQKMYSDTGLLIDKVVNHIKGF